MINKLRRIRNKRKLTEILTGIVNIPKSIESITVIVPCSPSNNYSGNNELGNKIISYKDDTLNSSGEYK